MKGETKTKKQLLEELAQLRQRIAELEAAGGQLSVFPQDVTELKQAEEALRESKQLYQSTLDNMIEGCQIIGYDWRYLYVNDAVAKQGRQPKEELLGRTMMEAYAGIETTPMFSVFRECMEKRTAHRMENEFTFSDGSKGWFDLSIQPMPEGIFILSLDITERKEAEGALRKSESRLKEAERIAQIGSWQLDLTANVLAWSDEIYRIFEIDPTQFGASYEAFLNLVHPEDRDFVNESYTRSVENKSPYDIVHRLLMSDGRIKFVREVCETFYDAEDKSLRSTGTVQDITEQKEAEEALQRSEQQLLQSQKMEAIGNLAGGVAHDFNNLLTVILGHSQLILERLDERDPLRRGMEQIHDAGERAATLTRQLLAFGRRQVLRAEVQDLNTIVANIEPMLRRIIGEDIDLVFVPGVELGWVKVDEGQIEQVIMNLATNSRDAMPQGGKLTIETANVYLDEEYARRHVAVTPGPHVMLAVSDTGVGMDKETQLHIFEPFFTTKEEERGTGLGLSTVYGIVKQSEGNIWVYSEPGKGTTFKIYLPRTEEEPEPEQPSAVREERLGGTETILVAEDDDAVRELVCQVCESSGYTLLIARNAGEALLTCERYRGKIDLMVTDVVMPGMGGPELAERLAPTHPEMKVLFMSGYTANAIVHHGVLDPGTPFLQKPFAPQALARKVREVLDAP